MPFDIASVLKGAAAKTEREQIVYIPLEDIVPNPDNFYTLEGIEDLAANIELIGLQQPLRIRPGKDGKYVVVSGHRRRAACLLISHGDSEGSHMFDQGVPCIIDNDACSDSMRELRLIFANSSTRVMTPADLSRQAERVEELLYQLKEEGVKFPGRMRDHVAKACAVNATKLANLHAIRSNLIPELLEEFDANRLNESVAYRISQEREQIQRQLASQAGDSIRGYTKAMADAAIEQIKAPKAGTAASEPQFDGRGHLVWDSEEYAAQRNAEDEEFAAMLEAEAVELLRRVNNIRNRRDGIEQLKAAHGKSHHGWNTRTGYANASPNGLTLEHYKHRAKITRTWTEVYDMLCTYVLNRAPGVLAPKVSKSDTQPEWRTGRPPVSGLYVMKSGVPKEEGPRWTAKRVAVWTGDRWVTIGPGTPINDNVYGWYKIPED
jgi:ParB-like chromosome segregation protein Spo0J